MKIEQYENYRIHNNQINCFSSSLVSNLVPLSLFYNPPLSLGFIKLSLALTSLSLVRIIHGIIIISNSCIILYINVNV